MSTERQEIDHDLQDYRNSLIAEAMAKAAEEFLQGMGEEVEEFDIGDPVG